MSDRNYVNCHRVGKNGSLLSPPLLSFDPDSRQVSTACCFPRRSSGRSRLAAKLPSSAELSRRVWVSISPMWFGASPSSLPSRSSISDLDLIIFWSSRFCVFVWDERRFRSPARDSSRRIFAAAPAVPTTARTHQLGGSVHLLLFPQPLALALRTCDALSGRAGCAVRGVRAVFPPRLCMCVAWVGR